jgi:enamine deaminase RidA (YjgF/YER057c/UK114 family)
VTRQHARSGSPFEDSIGFSRAVRIGGTIAVSGTAPVWPDGSVDPDPTAQARRCWEIMLAALEELGGSVGDVIRTRQVEMELDAVLGG